jgi:hypothetical protein
MFDRIIDNISLDKFKNLGSAYSFKDESKGELFYSVKGNEVLSVVDNLGNYFFAVKSNSGIESDKISSNKSYSITQEYTLQIIANCAISQWLVYKLTNMVHANTDNLSSIKMAVNKITEIRKKEKLILHEVRVTFTAHLNKCEVDLPCCC